MIYTDPAQAAPVVAAELAQARRVLLLSHINPDGDAIGSMLGTWHVLQAMGISAIPLASSGLPGFASMLPGIEQVAVYEPGGALPEADLVWMVDTAHMKRVGQVYEDHAETLAQCPLMIVDHHVTNEGEGRVNLIDSKAASCAELLFTLFRAMNAPVNAAAATCLMMGLNTDTQSFQTSNTRPQTLRIAADLMEAGADMHTIVQRIYQTLPYPTAQMLGQSLYRIQRENGLIWTSVSQEMIQQTNVDDSAYDDIIGVMQRIEGLRICALFRERSDKTVKISLRSKPGIDVSEIARIWNGGGHKQAAGATLPMGLEAAQREVLPVLRKQLHTA
jgi:phosphoesterase RecJ-like protein